MDNDLFKCHICSCRYESAPSYCFHTKQCPAVFGCVILGMTTVTWSAMTRVVCLGSRAKRKSVRL